MPKKAKIYHHYKATFLDYFKRQYSYVRYKIYVKNLTLYSSDRFLAINVIFYELFALSFP